MNLGHTVAGEASGSGVTFPRFRKRLGRSAIAFSVLFLCVIACTPQKGGNDILPFLLSSSATTAPTLSYPQSRYVFFQGAAVSEITPTATETISTCTVSPTLPAGLSLSAGTCAISGTPTSVQPEKVYAVSTTSNGSIGIRTVLSLRVANTSATRVYGQYGSMITTTANSGGISADSLQFTIGIAVDAEDGVYIPDGNCRILYYSPGSTTASRVYGQGGSFTSGTCNNGGITASSIGGVGGVNVDRAGGVYLVDATNNRILYYPSGSTTASRVYGQGGSFTVGTANTGGISSDSLSFPRMASADPSGGLYIVDQNNHRILYYASGSSVATRVYGQGGNFASAVQNNGGVSAGSISTPIGVHADSSGGVYIGDSGNNRVLYFAAGSTTATRVYGQGGSFSANTANNGGISADSLSFPGGMSLDAGGGLYVADQGNNRVLYYPAGSTTATRVYGQGGSFTSGTANNGGVTAASLSGPRTVAVDAAGGIYIADWTNNRILYY